MATMIKNKNGNALASLWQSLQKKRKVPDSWIQARGLIRDAKQRRSLERHVKKMRAEWR